MSENNTPDNNEPEIPDNNEATTNDAGAPVLPPPKPKSSRGPVIAGVGVVLVALIAGGVFLITRDGDDDGNSGENTAADGGDATGGAAEDRVSVSLGTTEPSQPHWELLVDLADEEGIDLEIRGFSEYTLPNPALAEEEIDINSFQHVLYLADHNNNTGDDLTPIGPTLIVPLPLYSEQYDSIEEFQDGDQIAIPNDATNQARALFVLQSAGLIEFAGDPAVPTPDDIDEAASTVQVRPVDASQTAGLINDGDIAGVVVNNNFATDAGFDLDGYVYADDPDSPGAQPYINVFAVRPGEEDNETYQTLVELYHTPEVLDSVVESSGGTAVIVDPQEYDAAWLQDLQAETEANLSAGS